MGEVLFSSSSKKLTATNTNTTTITIMQRPALASFVLLLLAASVTEVTSFRLIANLANAGGVGLGNCPRSCFSTCQAANFASTTSCTYTHVSRPFLGISETVTKTCNVCYPGASVLAG